MTELTEEEKDRLISGMKSNPAMTQLVLWGAFVWSDENKTAIGLRLVSESAT